MHHYIPCTVIRRIFDYWQTTIWCVEQFGRHVSSYGCSTNQSLKTGRESHLLIKQGKIFICVTWIATTSLKNACIGYQTIKSGLEINTGAVRQKMAKIFVNPTTSNTAYMVDPLYQGELYYAGLFEKLRFLHGKRQKIFSWSHKARNASEPYPTTPI